MIVGLTGGIGSGKSAAAKIFVELGIDVIDADELSKNVLIENQKAKKIFVEKFGQKYINSNDEIDRELLREDIFKDENQIMRASKRDNKTKNDIINIMKNQASSDERMSIADEVIKNDSSLDDLKKQVIKVHQKLLGINIDD